MITRTMLLSLGEESVANIRGIFNNTAHAVKAEASARIHQIADGGDFNSADLVSLSDAGRKLGKLETATDRLSYLVDNYETGGVNPEDKRRRRPRMKDAEEPEYNERW